MFQRIRFGEYVHIEIDVEIFIGEGKRRCKLLNFLGAQGLGNRKRMLFVFPKVSPG